MSKFRVDTDVLTDTINTYKIIADDINRAIRDAENAVNALKTSGWQSNAGKAFFDNFDYSWKVNMAKRVKVIIHLRQCLENARNEYEQLCSEAARLGNSL